MSSHSSQERVRTTTKMVFFLLRFEIIGEILTYFHLDSTIPKFSINQRIQLRITDDTRLY